MATKRTVPNIASRVDDQHTHVTLDVDLPGVSADSITLKSSNKYLTVKAHSRDTEYEATYRFCCRVAGEAIQAALRGDILHIEAPFDESYLTLVEATDGHSQVKSLSDDREELEPKDAFLQKSPPPTI